MKDGFKSWFKRSNVKCDANISKYDSYASNMIQMVQNIIQNTIQMVQNIGVPKKRKREETKKKRRQ